MLKHLIFKTCNSQKKMLIPIIVKIILMNYNSQNVFRPVIVKKIIKTCNSQNVDTCNSQNRKKLRPKIV